MAENDIGKGVSRFIADIRIGLLKKEKERVTKVAAKAAAVMIRVRTRSGQGAAVDYGSSYRLKPLSASYIDYRNAYSRRLSNETSPGKSNLTFTGQMLDSLTAKKIQPGSWQVILSGTNSGAGMSNAQLAKYVSRKRPFMFLTGEEISKLRDIARKATNI